MNLFDLSNPISVLNDILLWNYVISIDCTLMIDCHQTLFQQILQKLNCKVRAAEDKQQSENKTCLLLCIKTRNDIQGSKEIKFSNFGANNYYELLQQCVPFLKNICYGINILPIFGMCISVKLLSQIQNYVFFYQTTPFNNTQCETPLKLINPFHIMIVIGPELLSIFICLRSNLMIYHAQQVPKISSKSNKSNCAPIIPSNPKAHFQTAPGNSPKYGQFMSGRIQAKIYLQSKLKQSFLLVVLHMLELELLCLHQLGSRQVQQGEHPQIAVVIQAQPWKSLSQQCALLASLIHEKPWPDIPLVSSSGLCRQLLMLCISAPSWPHVPVFRRKHHLLSLSSTQT